MLEIKLLTLLGSWVKSSVSPRLSFLVLKVEIIIVTSTGFLFLDLEIEPQALYTLGKFSIPKQRSPRLAVSMTKCTCEF